jgi:hypothetical protein
MADVAHDPRPRNFRWYRENFPLYCAAVALAFAGASRLWQPRWTTSRPGRRS